MLLEGQPLAGWAWLLIALGQALLLALPVVPLALLVRAPRYRIAYRAWALAVVLGAPAWPAAPAPIYLDTAGRAGADRGGAADHVRACQMACARSSGLGRTQSPISGLQSPVSGLRSLVSDLLPCPRAGPADRVALAALRRARLLARHAAGPAGRAEPGPAGGPAARTLPGRAAVAAQQRPSPRRWLRRLCGRHCAADPGRWLWLRRQPDPAADRAAAAGLCGAGAGPPGRRSRRGCRWPR